MYCDPLTIGPWGHPSPLRHADVLNGWSLSYPALQHGGLPKFTNEYYTVSTVPSICRAIGNIRHGLRRIVYDQVLIMYILILMGQAKWLDNFVFK